MGTGHRPDGDGSQVQFASPNGLDRFLFETFFRGRRDGVFLDLAREPSPHGAVFARSMGWTVLRAPAGDAADFAARGVGAADYCALSAPAAGAIEAFKAARLLPAVISIANADEGFRAPMAETGYEFVVQLGSDSVFKRADVKRLPQISVICAVWHGDENRAALLKGHAANLARQTVPVEPI
jgi:hypothetical protein